MARAPRRPELRSGRAAEVISGREHRSYGISATESQDTSDLAALRFERTVARLYRLGPRVIAEMLAELGRQRLIRSEIEALVNKYAAIDPAVLRGVGGDRFSPWSLHVVGGSP